MERRSVWEVRAEVVTGIACAVLGVTTLVWSEWIEAIFGVDPDHGNGSLEWAVVVVLLVAAVALGTSQGRLAPRVGRRWLASRVTRRRSPLAETPPSGCASSWWDGCPGNGVSRRR